MNDPNIQWLHIRCSLLSLCNIMTPSSIIPNDSELLFPKNFFFEKTYSHLATLLHSGASIRPFHLKCQNQLKWPTHGQRSKDSQHKHTLSTLFIPTFKCICSRSSVSFYLRTAKQFSAFHAMSIIKSSWTKMHARKIKASLQRRQKVFAKISSSFSVELDCSDCAS